MLRTNKAKKHLSFHTPGHKQRGYDITELSYSDNLTSPNGCIAEAEKDIAAILGAKKSFILTDGSTSGVFSMLYAAKKSGVKKVLVPTYSHKSVYNGCQILGLEAVELPQATQNGVPQPIDISALSGAYQTLFSYADAVLITSPDYYGNIPELGLLSNLCKQQNKLLLIDGAHGGHLHFHKTLYAGSYADYWVDGVHKSLPALTQGAVVSAKDSKGSALLQEAVNIFRTTSPSYPIMASVEYAVKYPENKALEREAAAFRTDIERAYPSADWTKLCIRFGKSAYGVQKEFEKRGIYAEFCDGEYICFYLSPATKIQVFKRLKKEILRMLAKYPYEANTVDELQRSAYTGCEKEGEWVELSSCEGKVCMMDCGLFPPCLPLIKKGERVTGEKLARLKEANGVYGLTDGKMFVAREENE